MELSKTCSVRQIAKRLDMPRSTVNDLQRKLQKPSSDSENVLVDLEYKELSSPSGPLGAQQITHADEGWLITESGRVWNNGVEVLRYAIAYDQAMPGGGKRPIRGSLAVKLPTSEYKGWVPAIGNCSLRLVEELVAVEFIGYPPEMSFDDWKIAHIDGNTHNCAVNNLKWVPIKYDADLESLRRERISLGQHDRTGKSYRCNFNKVGLPTRPHRPLVFTNCKNIPGHKPVPSQRESASI
jgi:hypothetical protein